MLRDQQLFVMLVERLGGLNEHEQAVALHVFEQSITGLEKGRAVYGPLDLLADGRDFISEMRDEVLRDAPNYIGMDAVRARLRGL